MSHACAGHAPAAMRLLGAYTTPPPIGPTVTRSASSAPPPALSTEVKDTWRTRMKLRDGASDGASILGMAAVIVRGGNAGWRSPSAPVCDHARRRLLHVAAG